MNTIRAGPPMRADNRVKSRPQMMTSSAMLLAVTIARQNGKSATVRGRENCWGRHDDSPKTLCATEYTKILSIQLVMNRTAASAHRRHSHRAKPNARAARRCAT